MFRFLRCLTVISSLCGWCVAILVLNAWNCCMSMLFGLKCGSVAGNSGETCESRPSGSISPRRDEHELAQTLLRESSPRRPAHEFWASEYLAQARRVSPKRDPAWFSWCLFEPSPRRRGLAWARSFSLSEVLGEAGRCDYFLDLVGECMAWL